MAIDGKITRTDDDAITGWIASLTFDVDITLTKNPHKAKETHPDFEITTRTPRNRVPNFRIFIAYRVYRVRAARPSTGGINTRFSLFHREKKEIDDADPSPAHLKSAQVLPARLILPLASGHSCQISCTGHAGHRPKRSLAAIG